MVELQSSDFDPVSRCVFADFATSASLAQVDQLTIERLRFIVRYVRLLTSHPQLYLEVEVHSIVRARSIIVHKHDSTASTSN